MIRLTFAQMRRSIGRLSAAGIAIAIGTAFIVVTLLAGTVISRTTFDSISASFGKADLVVSSHTLSADQIDQVAAAQGVAAVQPQISSYVSLSVSGKSTFQYLIPAAADERLNPLEAVTGRFPTTSGEIALPGDFAERLGVTVDDAVTVRLSTYPEYDDEGNSLTGSDEPEQINVPLTIVGLVADPNGAYAMFGGAAVVTEADLSHWAQIEGYPLETGQLAVALTPGSSDRDAIAAIEASLNDSGITVQTRDEAASALAKNFTGGEDILTNIVLAFAGLSLLVAGLVIANTFQVLVAQRTRTLAMLRCVGANKRQLRMSVLVEAGVLGLGASIVGIVVGSALGQLALMILNNFDFGVPLPKTISITPAVLIVPIIAGVAVTTIAALSPARAATRVSPLAAMRPADAPSVRSGGIVRFVFALLFALGGFALLGLGVLLGSSQDPTIALMVGMLGGAVSFVGVVVGAVFWIPAVTRLVGRVVSKFGPSGKLAAANTVRNPRRTAATSTALLIGVTLVVMMSTGAISARQTLNQGLDEQYPIDAWATSYQYGPEETEDAISATLRSQIDSIDGVTSTLPITATIAGFNGDESWPVSGIDPVGASEIARDPHVLDGLTDKTILIESAWGMDLVDGQEVTLTGSAADGTATKISRTVVLGDSPLDRLVISNSSMAELSPTAAISDLWIALDPQTDAYAAVNELQELLGDTNVAVQGAAVERVMFQQVIDALLAVVVGLLAVAVVIALIGVANTLSLSVIERQRENAMLRAIGLSRKQLRATLAVEGILIAVVGTGLGVLLGLGYGWAGSLTVLNSIGDVHLAVPWRDLIIVLAVALVAGLLASVLPARRAVRTSPVEALAVD